MQFIVLGNRAQKTPPKASRDQLLYASSAGKTETVFRARNRLKDSSRAKDVYINPRLRKRDTAGKESINQSDVPSKGARFERKSYR